MARRFQRGSVYLHRLKNGMEVWQGRYWEEVVMPDGSLRRVRRKISLGSKRELRTQRQARRALQPYVDKANAILIHVEPSQTTALSIQPSLIKAIVSFRTFAEKWKDEILIHSKPSTRETARYRLSKWLLPAFGKFCLGDVRAEPVQAFFNSMVSKVSIKTMLNVRNVLASILKQARAWEYITHDPLAGLKLPKYKPVKKKIYTVEHVVQIIANLPVQYRTLGYFLVETGIRAGEVAIEIPDTNFMTRKITIRQAIWRGHKGSPKTDAGIRTFHISNQLAALLKNQIGGRSDGPVFPSRSGKPIDMHNFRSRILAKARKAAEVDYGDVHTFRHFNATIMDSLRVPLAVKRLRLGHEGESVTDDYTDVLEEDDRDAAEKIAALIFERLDPQLTFSGAITTSTQ